MKKKIYYVAVWIGGVAVMVCVHLHYYEGVTGFAVLTLLNLSRYTVETLKEEGF